MATTSLSTRGSGVVPTAGTGAPHGDMGPALLPRVEVPTSEATGSESRMSEIFKDGRINHS